MSTEKLRLHRSHRNDEDDDKNVTRCDVGTDDIPPLGVYIMSRLGHQVLDAVGHQVLKHLDYVGLQVLEVVGR